MTKPIRRVTIVVPVLMTNCHVSLKLNIGPVIIHAAMTPTARTNTLGRPQKCAAAFAKLVYQAALGIWDLSSGAESGIISTLPRSSSGIAFERHADLRRKTCVARSPATDFVHS